MKHDYLIIGQGLAGSILAYQLLKRDRSVAIIDERNPTSSSRVAAGLANPFTGPKMVKSWRAEELFPYLKQFYPEVENATKASFLSEKIIYRPFNSVEEINDWDGRSAQLNYKKFLKTVREKDAHKEYVNDPFGGVEIVGHVLNVSVFLDASNAYFEKKCTVIDRRFDESLLEITENGIKYQEIEARKVIYCTGYQIQHSAYFSWLPMAPVKGEILHLKLKTRFETIYNQSCFIIPQENGIYKAGSTYNRLDLTDMPTETGKNEITKKLDVLLKMQYEIVDHEAGIRPGTVPRRPLIGAHPDFENVFVFNGLGTKGVSLAPFFSDHLVKNLEDGNNLDPEVDIKKYYSLYFKPHFSRNN